MSSAPLLRLLLIGLLLLGLNGCSSLGGHDPLQVNLVGIEPLPGEGLEMRFAVKLRVQNPNARAVDFQGVALQLRVNQQPLASGVSDQRGQLPGFGESLISIPVSISAYSLMRQAWAAAGYQQGRGLPYELSGKLGGGLFATQRFNASGKLDWPQPRTP
ncbi:LEA type 2 family protein [Pseudomonas xionganensis]|uniref:Water stress/hypersensitive response domain-containing protein n=1 Tax=Pseudomonas xionganensis TaxID=2654845 RepID=A0A6I4KWM9_9PSED|nr:LEA type 2 family protein [Pseudomonas xionganensis]MVW74926.1 water stress/hypersensitive response domain-containing protein [Pseudomonas xionganensis]